MQSIVFPNAKNVTFAGMARATIVLSVAIKPAGSLYRHSDSMHSTQSQTKRLLAGLCLGLLWGAAHGLATDQTFDLLQTKTGVYSNVTVTTKSKDYIVIQHAAGLTSLKATELSPEVQEKLGYVPTKSKLNLGSLTVTAKARALVEAIPATKIEAAWNKYAPAGTQLKLDDTVIKVALALVLVGYLGFCFCGAMICRKAGSPAGILIWIPILQYVPLFRAAKMSPLWILGMFVPLLNIWGHVKWSFRIAHARGKGFWTALLLVLPTYPLAFIYLAFAGSAPPPEEELPPEKFQATGHVLAAE